MVRVTSEQSALLPYLYDTNPQCIYIIPFDGQPNGITKLSWLERSNNLVTFLGN